MIVTLINQPLGALRLGDLLIDQLDKDPVWNKFNSAVAFVKQSGVRHLAVHIRDYVKHGGHVKIAVGVDLGGTSLEGLNTLLNAIGNGGNVSVFHNENGHTFHPKVYLFESDETALAIVGSGNLSEGGVFTNYEASLSIELDKQQENDAALLREINGLLDYYTDPNTGLSLQLNQDLITKLVENGYISSEEKATDDAEENQGSHSRPAIEPGKKLFGNSRVRGAPTLTTDILIGRRDRQSGHPRKAHMAQEARTEIAEDNSAVLIRYIAKAGGRTSQVHFTRAIVERYFGLRPGDGNSINIFFSQPGEAPGRMETRPLVFSQRNQNSKIEMEGLRDRIPDNYPAEGRAILIVQRVENGRYKYLLLLPNDTGYLEINSYLSHVPKYRQALQEDVMSLNRLLEIWPNYPI